MKWLITGGCGFIGKNLIQSLLSKKEHGIRVLDNLSVGSRGDLASVCSFEEALPEAITCGPECGTCQLIVGDILDTDALFKAMNGIDIVVHLAASTGVEPSVKDPLMDCKHNVIGTLNTLEAARQNKIKRFVFASSGAPIGECTPPIHEEMPAHPVSPYGASKLAGEGYCSAYFRTYGLETVALRFSNVYGPGSSHKTSVVASFLRQALNGEPLQIHGDGNQTRDFIYIADLVNAIEKAAVVSNIGGEIFQIATNEETNILQIVEFIIRLFEKETRAIVTCRHESSRVGDVKRNFSNTQKAKMRLLWKPSISLEEGLNKTFHWFRSDISKTEPQLGLLEEESCK